MSSLRAGGFLIAKVHQLSGRIFARKLKEYGIEEINPAQGRILFALWQQDEIPINELAQKTSLGKSTLTSMLDRLEAAGYLLRQPSREDRRKIFIKRTEKDKNLQQVYTQVSQAMVDLFYQGLTGAEVDQFEATLQHILRNLEAIETGAGEELVE
jgi:MarR family transcriptional regulator, organic hydroperoxide resistance regulator